MGYCSCKEICLRKKTMNHKYFFHYQGYFKLQLAFIDKR